MLLEINELHALIVAGAAPPAPLEVATWREFARHYRCLIYVRDTDEFNAWFDAVSDSVTILFWNTKAANEVADNLRAGMEKLQSEPFETVYIAFDAADLVEAVAARVGTIQLGGDWQGVLPDIYLDDITELAQTLAERRHGRDRAYIGELFSTMTGKTQRWPGTGVLMWDDNLLARAPDLDPHVTNGLRVAILGRYFPPSDFRHVKHQLSRRILYSKHVDTRARPIFEPLGFGLRHLVDTFGYDMVTRVPPKPRAEHDHIAWLVANAAKRAEVRLTPQVSTNALSTIRDFPSQKFAGSFARRVANVANAFRADKLVRGRRVLLVDDVLTSGATVTSAASALLDAGAAMVGVLVIAYNQNCVHRGYGEPGVPCASEGCRGRMILQFSTKSDAAFWGCSRWREGCTARLYFRPGLSALNAENLRTLIEVSPDIGF